CHAYYLLLFFLLLPLPPRSTLFPYTTLFRSWTPLLTKSSQILFAYFICLLDREQFSCRWFFLFTFANLIVHYPQISSTKLCDLRSEEHTSELQSRENLVCRLLLEKKKQSTVA